MKIKARKSIYGFNCLLSVLLLGFVLPSVSKAQIRNYELSQRTDSIVRLIASDLEAEALNKVVDDIRNLEADARVRKLQEKLEKAKGNDRLELELNERLGRESKWGESVNDAYFNYTQMLYLAEKLEDERSIAIACYELGNLIRLGTIRNRQFRPYFNRAIEIFEKLDDPLSKSYMLYAKLILEEDGKVRLAYAERAIELLKANLNRSDSLMMESLGRHLNVLGLNSEGEKQFQSFREGLEVVRAIGDHQLEAYILNNMGFIHLLRNEFDLATPYHLEALDVSINAGIKGLAANSFNNLTRCFKEKGLYLDALNYFKGFFVLQSYINNDVYYQNLAEMEVTHEVDRVELQNELLLNEQKLEARLRIILVTIAILLLVIVALILWSRRKIAKANQRLMALDEVKSRFFANISHELRTPLTLINAPLESLIMNGEIKDPELRNTLETATRNGQSLLGLVEEILDLAKLDGGKLELVENPVRLNNFLELLLSDYTSGFKNKSISLVYDYELDSELAILIDENRCTKVINNLLSNALKFTPEGGEIRVKVEEAENGSLLKISVQDNGVGIHPDDLPHIFDRYFQSEQRNKKAEGGTGIGLALARELARLHGGSLTVSSELGKGTIFTFSLPLKRAQEATIQILSQSSDEALNVALKGTIEKYREKFEVEKPVLLVTEDHPEMREFIAKTLAPFFSIKQAENGKVALDILKSNRIDVVISDVMMPVMDGFELLEEIKKDPALHQVSLIMLTARADHDDKLYALTLGIDDYLTKPFSASEFLARIRNILENRIKIIRELNREASKMDFSELAAKYDLVEREVEILQLLAKRYSNPEIAEALFISRNTVKFHIKNIFEKMGIKSRQEAADLVNSEE